MRDVVTDAERMRAHPQSRRPRVTVEEIVLTLLVIASALTWWWRQ